MEQLEMKQFKFEEVKMNYDLDERTRFEISQRKKLNKMRTLVCKKNKRGRIYKHKLDYVKVMNTLKRVMVEFVARIKVTKNVTSLKEVNEKLKEANQKLRDKIELNNENRRIKKEERRIKND